MPRGFWSLVTSGNLSSHHCKYWRGGQSADCPVCHSPFGIYSLSEELIETLTITRLTLCRTERFKVSFIY